jgi:predicted nucleotidyltransferase
MASGPPALDLDELAPNLHAVIARHPDIAAVWIFGSAVRHALRSDSDVDFAVLFRRGAGNRAATIADLAARVEKFTAPHPADVMDLEAQGVIFAHRVLCSGRRIYEADRDRRVDFESTTCVRAFDFQPTHELAVRGQKEGLLRRLEREQPR